MTPTFIFIYIYTLSVYNLDDFKFMPENGADTEIVCIGAGIQVDIDSAFCASELATLRISCMKCTDLVECFLEVRFYY